MSHTEQFARRNSRKDEQWLPLVGAARAILIRERQTRSAGLDSINSVEEHACHSFFTPAEELDFDALGECLVHGSLGKYVRHIVASKGVPNCYQLSACRDVAGTFILALPSLRNFDTARSVRSFLRKTALTTSRSFRRAELKFHEQQSMANNEERPGFAGLNIRTLRQAGRNEVEARHGDDDVIYARSSKIVEPVANVLETDGRVAVKMPEGVDPTIKEIYLSPELAIHLESLQSNLRAAILLRTSGYSTKEGADVMGCSCSHYKTLLAKARIQLKALLESPSTACCVRRQSAKRTVKLGNGNRQIRRIQIYEKTHSSVRQKTVLSPVAQVQQEDL